MNALLDLAQQGIADLVLLQRESLLK